jgi:hypothetical protein
MKRIIEKWASGHWDDEVWSWVIHVIGVACLLTYFSEVL